MTQRIAERLTDWNAVVEPFESVATVYRHRAYWKPAQVKVVPLAESHLVTHAKELANNVFDWAEVSHVHHDRRQK